MCLCVCVCAAFFSLESFVSVHDNEHSYVAEAKATLNFAYVEIFIAIFSVVLTLLRNSFSRSEKCMNCV